MSLKPVKKSDQGKSQHLEGFSIPKMLALLPFVTKQGISFYSS